MESKEVVYYSVDGFSDIKKFAEAILVLTNLKSNDLGIIDLKTHQETNVITIIAEEENDSWITSYVGEIISKEKGVMLELNADDITKKAHKDIDNIDDDIMFSDLIYFTFDF